MTEAEWWACADSRPLLEEVSHKTSDRKLRLLICACCHRVWDLLADDRSREAVEVAERYADSSANRDDLIAARRKADAAYQWARKQHGPAAFRIFCAAHLALQATSIAKKVRFDPRENEFMRGAKERQEKTERKARSNLIRDIIGNPFQPVHINSAWRTPTVLALAQDAYDQRDLPAGTLNPDRLGILADALEDAGCSEVALLEHLRGPGPHVRGCFAVDAVLGKE
jgi:hypothetical protein